MTLTKVCRSFCRSFSFTCGEALIVALLELQNVSYQSENKSILKNISLQIDAGDYLSIIGPFG
jgi:ABC-type molybdenum transport system ATPase subunit/photorepair protein PhrA